MIAFDSVGQPDPAQIKAEGGLFVAVYVGTQYQHYGTTRPYIDSCLEAGIGVGLIFEEWASQFLGGKDVAVQMMTRMHRGWDALGAPSDGSVIPLIAVVDPSPSAVLGHEDDLRQFVRGIEEALWLPEWTGYGSHYGLDLAGEVGPRMTRKWGVGTWGYGEGPAPEGQLAEALPFIVQMIQHGNRSSPIPGTDLNTVFRPDMGQWGGPAPAPTREVQDAMIYADAAGHALAWDGGIITADFDGPTNDYGIPLSAVKYADDHHVEIVVSDSLLLDKLRIADKNAMTAPTPDGEAPDDLTKVDDGSWTVETNRRLEAGQIGLGGGTIIDL